MLRVHVFPLRPTSNNFQPFLKNNLGLKPRFNIFSIQVLKWISYNTSSLTDQEGRRQTTISVVMYLYDLHTTDYWRGDQCSVQANVGLITFSSAGCNVSPPRLINNNQPVCLSLVFLTSSFCSLDGDDKTRGPHISYLIFHT